MQANVFQKEFSRLNKEQKNVVESIYGPIMVVAGPGTGKTQIIALRTANIIKETKIDPSNILITTFTEAGVIAIKNRLAKFIGTDAYKVKVATIHSFSQDIISSYPEEFADFKASKAIDDVESLELFTSILDDFLESNLLEYLFHPTDKYIYLRDIKDRISKLKGEGIRPEDFDRIIDKLRQDYDEALTELENNKKIRDLEKRKKKDSDTYKKHIGKLKELNLIYKEYQNRLKQNSLYDFSDMINFVLEKLKTDENLRDDLAEKYQFIMVDEYQDTNNPQNEILNLILSVGEDKNIMVVGDDDQSIYRFQGANIENMLDFITNYPNTQFIVLKNNYRSAQSILDLSTNLIKNNTQRLENKLDFIKKELIAQSEYKNLDNNKYYILQDEIIEKNFVLEDIKKKTPPLTPPLTGEGNGEVIPPEKGEPEGGVPSFAIICRSNKEVEEWTNFFQNNGLQVESKLKTNILNNDYVKFLLDFLALIENPELFSNEKLIDILRTDIVDVENIDVLTLTKELYKKNYSKGGFKDSLWELIKNETSPLASTSSHPNPLLQERELKQKVQKIPSPLGESWDENSKKQILFELNQEEKYKDFNKIVEFKNLILELNEELGLHGISRLFQKILDKLGLIEYIETHGTFSDLEDIYTLFNKIKDFNEKNPDLTLKNLLNKFELYKKYNISIPRQILKKQNSNIEILTAHSSKGLEYDYVYIPGCYAGNWENKRVSDKLKLPLGLIGKGLQFSDLDQKEIKKLEKEIQIQEDRRLFFVAMTRAKRELIFTRPAGKDIKAYIDSPFILETGISPVLETGLKGDRSQIKDSIKQELLGKDNLLIKTTKEEIDYIGEFLQTYKLSPTDLNTFLQEPKQFLKSVVFKYPFEDNENTIFGKVYHRVLELATQKKMKGEKLELGYLTETFKYLLDKQVLTSQEKDRLLKRGIDGLTGYFEIFSKNPRIPLTVEYNFRPKNIVFEGVRITGKIDKVELVNTSPLAPLLRGEGSQGALFTEDVAIVDYKTGSIKTEGKIKGIDRYGNKKDSFEEGKYYRQLLFYKLLAENDKEFNSKFNIVELGLDFVEGKNGEYKYIPVTIDSGDYEEFKELVKDSWEKINSLEFWEEILFNEK